jgi:carboxypeptidase T
MVTLRIHWLALLVAIGAMFLVASPLQAQTQAPAVQLWRVSFADQSDLNRLAGELDVWEVDHIARYLLAPLTADQVAALRINHQVTLAPDQSQLHPPTIAPRFDSNPTPAQSNGIPGFACYRTVDETYATFDQLVLEYPHLARQVDIGDSWDKGDPGSPAGDDLRVLILTNQQQIGPKFRFMLMGAIHARELATAEVALRFAESLLQNYGKDAAATWLLDHGELHLLALANPDGRRKAETGLLWRKNTHTDDSCSVNNNGVDLNRNSSFQWNSCPGCSSGYSCAETYRGGTPASEPEVAAIEAYARSIFPDQRDVTLEASAPIATPGLFISLHSYGRLVLFPWGWDDAAAPNGPELATLARRFGYHTGYKVCQAGAIGCLYQTDGTTDDWSYGELGVASFTFELGTNFFQSCTDFENTILQPTLAALRYGFMSAPLPYQLPAGPEVLNLVVTPTGSVTQTHVTMIATADASRIATLSGTDSSSLVQSTELISAARVTIDQLPWENTPFTWPLTPVDGQFNNLQETITGTVETACLPSGRHTLYVQAQDSAGDWGVVAAELITVTNSSSFSATVENDQGNASIGVPVTYTVEITNISTTTATFTLETNGEIEATSISPAPITLAAGEASRLSVFLIPQNNSAATIVPTLLKIRSVVDPSLCRQLQVTTTVAPRQVQEPFIQRLLIIRKS